MRRPFRIGQIVPSSNITMETEIPAMLKAREAILPERFTFHSSRMRMKNVTKQELEAMDEQSLRCAVELADAQVDVMGYACLVAIMSMGMGYHRESENKLGAAAREAGCNASVITSAGALVDTLQPTSKTQRSREPSSLTKSPPKSSAPVAQNPNSTPAPAPTCVAHPPASDSYR